MCGFAGLVAPSSGRPIGQAELEPMVRAIAHRGPDDESVHVEPGAGLAFRRLSIVDLEGGRQPLSNEDESIWLVFNGEIYNHLELRKELERKGHWFRTRCDAEVIVHGYEEWGGDVAKRLRGIFAFAVWDRAPRKLLLGRDHSGIKPLYFSWVGDELLFGSEAKAILASGRVDRRLDLVGLFRHHQRAETFEDTPFAGIRQVAAGCTVAIDPRGMAADRYWSFSPSSSVGAGSDPEIVEEFRSLLAEVVGMQLMADVPVAAYLSGGIDSSAVVACAVRGGYERLRTYTTASRDYDDGRFSRLLLNHLGIEGKFLEHKAPAELSESIREVAWMAEGIFDLGFLARFALSRAVREDGIKVILTGQGIDEVLSGYAASIRAQAQNLKHRAVWNPPTDWKAPPWFTERVLSELSCDPRLRLAGAELSPEEVEARLIGDDLATWHASLSLHLLRFEDRMGMANGVEVRVPLLDHVLLEFIGAVPHGSRRSLFSGKRILREAARPWLPDVIADRPKVAGFNSSLTPLSRLLIARPGEDLARLLTKAEVERRGYFDWSYCAGRTIESDYMALDAIFLVHILDEVFVTRPLDERLGSTWTGDLIGANPPSAAPPLREEDVPALHVDVIGFRTFVQPGGATISMDSFEVVFAQGPYRGTSPILLTQDHLQLIALVDGERSCRRIIEAFAEEEEETSPLLGALQGLMDAGVLVMKGV